MGATNSQTSSLSDLYPEILKSRTLSRRLLDRQFDTNKYGKKQSLLKILTYGNEDPPNNLEVLKSVATNNLTNNVINVKPAMNGPLIHISAKTLSRVFLKN